MLLGPKHLRGFQLSARDGELGSLESILFDDDSWATRYLHARTGAWFGNEVLLAPDAVGTIADGHVHVHLTKDEIKSSPPIESDAPVSHQDLEALHQYYGWTVWWGAPVAAPRLVQGAGSSPDESSGDRHLRSSTAMLGLRIEATDGAIGHVEDLVLDTDAWEIRSIIVDTREWLPGRHVMIPRDRVHAIDWPARVVRLSLTRHAVEASPAFDPSAPINASVETVFSDYYGRVQA